VWFAEPLLSGATDEIRKLFDRAIEIADRQELKVVLWISDKQDAFVKCVADMFPGVPHRFCVNHFFRDLAKPVLALDSTAKKKKMIITAVPATRRGFEWSMHWRMCRSR